MFDVEAELHAIFILVIFITVFGTIGFITLYRKVNLIRMSTKPLPQEITDLQAAVAAEQTVEQSAIALLQNLSAQLTAALASADPTGAVEAVVANINTNAAALAAAVTANTPAQ